MKRLFAIILAAMLLLGLAACGGGEEEIRWTTGGGSPAQRGPIDPADVTWDGEYPGMFALLNVSDYDGTSFYFTLDTVDDRVEGTAKLYSDNPLKASYGEYCSFRFDPDDGSIVVNGGDFPGRYERYEREGHGNPDELDQEEAEYILAEALGDRLDGTYLDFVHGTFFEGMDYYIFAIYPSGPYFAVDTEGELYNYDLVNGEFEPFAYG